ncbi:MAG: GNAT family N-acetyltransferase [Bernardetiaceae bacterium]
MLTTEIVSFDSPAFAELRAIRHRVFVEEQHVPPEEEFDQYETDCRHFVVRLHGQAVGVARWRKTEAGCKLERFAVLEEYRGQGIGQVLVSEVMADIAAHQSSPCLLYLHAQLPAVSLYARFGFVRVGEPFEECAIWHYRMEQWLTKS